jgi:hydroxymethylpyrimidine/phosphomethylpyrimidine kinase
MTATVLSIGTTHPWNVAGVGRDLVVGAELGARVFTAVAAVSAQDGRGIVALHPIPPDTLRAQLDALPWESAGAARVGALPNVEAVRAVRDALRARPWLAAVVDPAFSASRGGELGDASAREGVREELATLRNVVLTPNLEEAALLLGSTRIERAAIGEAALALRARGALAVLVKGGHLEGDPADALASDEGLEIFTDARIAGRMHGIGCTLAMSLACELAAGAPLPAAVRAARSYVRAQIARH